MSAQEYTVVKVFSQSETKYPGKYRIAFSTEETGNRSLSCFTPYPETVQPGKMVYGEVVEKEVNGSIFYNFSFTKKELGGSVGISTALTPNPGIDAIKNALTLKVIPLLEEIRKLLGRPMSTDHSTESTKREDEAWTMFDDDRDAEGNKVV